MVTPEESVNSQRGHQTQKPFLNGTSYGTRGARSTPGTNKVPLPACISTPHLLLHLKGKKGGVLAIVTQGRVLGMFPVGDHQSPDSGV